MICTFSEMLHQNVHTNFSLPRARDRLAAALMLVAYAGLTCRVRDGTMAQRATRSVRVYVLNASHSHESCDNPSPIP